MPYRKIAYLEKLLPKTELEKIYDSGCYLSRKLNVHGGTQLDKLDWLNRFFKEILAVHADSVRAATDRTCARRSPSIWERLILQNKPRMHAPRPIADALQKEGKGDA